MVVGLATPLGISDSDCLTLNSILSESAKEISSLTSKLRTNWLISFIAREVTKSKKSTACSIFLAEGTYQEKSKLSLSNLALSNWNPPQHLSSIGPFFLIQDLEIRRRSSSLGRVVPAKIDSAMVRDANAASPFNLESLNKIRSLISLSVVSSSPVAPRRKASANCLNNSSDNDSVNESNVCEMKTLALVSIWPSSSKLGENSRYLNAFSVNCLMNSENNEELDFKASSSNSGS
ncbi:hypothetical protein OGAPHI_005224 [Ogataea philodendri]|uniref:Uncharacterized protein n=1 Tax=Ogataea philodendri TaxID=1378263 RepID=A0A9P8P2I9_9ASCO|nr:uncharacterized protein OGAPHI_005224 [Ogataea philodendri]KAH3663821.1 hypothetical protein OGAPHI_005224 [Ogataea philodendri]